MFKDVSNLQELNKARVEAVQSGKDRLLINSLYNAKKKEILAKQIPYEKVPIYRSTYEDSTPVIYLPFAGKSTKKNTIELTPQGFLC